MQIDANIPEILRAVDPTLASYTRGDVNYQARALAATHADKFLQHITEIRLDPTIPDSATADALNPEYASRLVRDGLSIMTPTYSLSQEVAFELEPLPERRLKLSTNLDFEMVNRFWRFGPDQQITAAHLLDWILKVHEEFAFAGHFASELVRSPFSSSLLRTKTEDLLAREQSVAVQGAFHNLLFEDARSVREAVNSGERSLLDALELSERGRRFRDWTSTIDVDEDLVREYLRACTAESLPSLSRVVFATSSRTEQWRAGAGGSGTRQSRTATPGPWPGAHGYFATNSSVGTTLGISPSAPVRPPG